MQPFVFHNPTKIVFGEGTVPQIGAEARAWGRRALFLYGQSSIKRNGVYDLVVASLKAAGMEFVEFPGVKPNPVLSHAREGVALAKREKVDLVVAVGGGSVLDEAKTIALGAATDVDVWDFFCQKAQPQASLPLATVLTLPATGSEMNGGQVITNEKTREKFGFATPWSSPKVSILDPSVTHTISAEQTAYAAADAMTHLLEGYFTHTDPWTPIQDRYVEGLVKTIMECAERIQKDLRDAQARATLMWAATLAWNGLALAGVGTAKLPNHMMEHPLSGIYDIPHGAGLSIVLPAWMAYTARQNPQKIAQFARNVFGVPATSAEEEAELAVAGLKTWFQKIGTPTSLSAVRIPAEDIERIARDALTLGALWGITEYSKESLIEIYRMCA
ncbi:MAG: iron-containing alcohol dehydrogenase [Planctomycetota bacterium]